MRGIQIISFFQIVFPSTFIISLLLSSSQHHFLATSGHLLLFSSTAIHFPYYHKKDQRFPFFSFLFFLFFFFFFGCTCGTWKFPGQRSKQSCNWSLRHSQDNTGSGNNIFEPYLQLMLQLTATLNP